MLVSAAIVFGVFLFIAFFGVYYTSYVALLRKLNFEKLSFKLFIFTPFIIVFFISSTLTAKFIRWAFDE